MRNIFSGLAGVAWVALAACGSDQSGYEIRTVSNTAPACVAFAGTYITQTIDPADIVGTGTQHACTVTRSDTPGEADLDCGSFHAHAVIPDDRISVIAPSCTATVTVHIHSRELD